MWSKMLSSNRRFGAIDLEIVCVYNNAKIFQESLVVSLMNQELQYNVRLNAINNTCGKYGSMAEAYNDNLELLKGKWTIFLHQDIVFNKKNSLSNNISELYKLDANSVFGYAGVVRTSRDTIVAADSILEVETVDECFFGMETEWLKQLKFNEQFCDNWHMYAVEICLHNKFLGGKNYLVKADITHLSPGTISKSYVKTLYKLIDYYKKIGGRSNLDNLCKRGFKKPYCMYILIWMLKHEVLNKIIRPLKRLRINNLN